MHALFHNPLPYSEHLVLLHQKNKCANHRTPLQKPSLTHCKSWELRSRYRQGLQSVLVFPFQYPLSHHTANSPSLSSSFPSLGLSPSSPSLSHAHFYSSQSPALPLLPCHHFPSPQHLDAAAKQGAGQLLLELGQLPEPRTRSEADLAVARCLLLHKASQAPI